jgi:hypothetical protein
MQLSDSISILYNKKTTLTPQLNESLDPSYLFDLKTHLQENETYRKERREFYKLHPTWSLYRARDEFARQYIERFHDDLSKFASYYPGLPPQSLAEKFCQAWVMYGEVVGVEFVERGLRYLTR